MDGTSLLTGHGEPLDTLGKNGDSYINLDNWNYYLKNNDSWSFVGNIKGESQNTKDERWEKYGIPIIDLNGDVSNISKQNKCNIELSYNDEKLQFECDAKIKLQGSYSTLLPKTNYSLQLYEKGTNYKTKYGIELFDGLGKQNKYCLKANYLDFTQSANIVSAHLFNHVLHSGGYNDSVSNLPNGGQTDGFPVMVYLNGNPLGLYTLNIPKDKWMFGLKNDENVRTAVVNSKTRDDDLNLLPYTTRFLTEHTDYSFSKGLNLEFCSTEESATGTNWVADSINVLIDFLAEANSETFVQNIGNFVDLKYVIDYIVFNIVSCNMDAFHNNVIFVTLDGTKWLTIPYDLDATWNVRGDCSFDKSVESILFGNGYNRLFERIYYSDFYAQIVERYKELRQSVYSFSNIDSTFVDYFQSIKGISILDNYELWPESEAPNKSYSKILNWIHDRLLYLDSVFEYDDAFNNNFKVVFNVDAGGSVSSYLSQNTDIFTYIDNKIYARNSETGHLDSTGDGQINFKVNVPLGYKINKIEVDGNYKNLKELGNNIYRVTKITSDLSISISFVENN